MVILLLKTGLLGLIQSKSQIFKLQIGKIMMKTRDIIKIIKQDGWYLARIRGSHRQYKHSTKPGLVTIPGKPGDDLAPGTVNSILKQAGLK